MAGSTSGSNKIKNGDVYRAAVKGESVDAVLIKFYMENPTSPINDHGDTVLHVLALNCRAEAAVRLLNLPMGLSSVKNCNGNTALHEAARVGALKIAKLMVKKEPSLVNDRNLLGETPLFWSAAYGKTEMFLFLIKETKSQMGLKRNDGLTILHVAVMGEFYGLALEIVRRYPYLADACNAERKTALHLLGQSPFSFRSGTLYAEIHIVDSSFIPWAMLKSLIYLCIHLDASKENLADLGDPHENEGGQSLLQAKRKPGMVRQLFRRCPCFKAIDDAKQKHKLALELVQLLVEGESLKWDYNISDEEDSTDTIDPWRKQTIKDTTVLAAKHGIVEIVDVILKECPWAIEFRDYKGKNILHLAAEHRHVGVFKLLISKKFLLNKMVADVDNEGNTALHLAADYQEKKFYVPSYQMAREVLWFKQVKAVFGDHISHIQNSKGKTADEIFEGTHQDLLSNSVEWSKKTTNTFMVISTLIATVNFSAAFAVPGGYDQNIGLPVFTGKVKDFPTFYAYSTVALFFSVVTLGSSFSAYLSRFHSDDFYFFLPLKYLIGGTSLFYSTFYTVFAYIQALILETNGRSTTLQFSLGYFASAIAIAIVNLIFIDIMFPVFRYMIDLFGIHSISHHGQRK